MLFPSGAFYFEFNQLEDTSIWDSPFEKNIAQTSKGALHGSSFFYSGVFSILGCRNSSVSLFSLGTMPSSYCGFGFNATAKPQLVGEDKASNGLISYVEEGTEISVHTPNNYSAYFVIINTAELEKFATAENFSQFKSLQQILRQNIISSIAITHSVIQLIDHFSGHTQNLQSENYGLAYRDLEHSIFTSILKLHELFQYTTNRLNKRSKITYKAINYISNASLNKVSILDIANSVNTSQRNLEIAFASILDTTPKAFLAGYRLSAIRKELLSTHSKSIKEIARRYGVTHMGHFASYYLSYFGESPTETRRKSLNISNES